MSRLLWFLTGAGNVDNIQCPQRKADRDKGGGGGGGGLYSYCKCLSSSIMLHSVTQHCGSYQNKRSEKTV